MGEIKWHFDAAEYLAEATADAGQPVHTLSVGVQRHVFVNHDPDV